MNDWTLRLPPVLLAAVLVHTALAPNLRVFGVSADVLLLLSIAAGVAAGPEPVSYTHLTLPTNREV